MAIFSHSFFSKFYNFQLPLAHVFTVRAPFFILKFDESERIAQLEINRPDTYSQRTWKGVRKSEKKKKEEKEQQNLNKATFVVYLKFVVLIIIILQNPKNVNLSVGKAFFRAEKFSQYDKFSAFPSNLTSRWFRTIEKFFNFNILHIQ